MNSPQFRRAIRVCLLLVGLAGVVGAAQPQGGRIAFSILNGEDIVHVSQIEFRATPGQTSVTSTIGITHRTPLRLAPDEGFSRTFVLNNDTASPQTFRATLILDDQQTAFSLDGTARAQHTLSVPANSQLRMTATFPGSAQSGLHNFVLIVFYDVRFPDSAAQGLFTPYADSLLVGEVDPNQESLARPDEDAFVLGATVPATRNVPPSGLTFSRVTDPTSEGELLKSPLSLPAGQPLDYHIHVRNGLPRQGEADEFVLIVLLDGAQPPIDEAQPVAYFRLPRNGLATIPARLAALGPGTHTLDALAIRNPYDFLLSMGSLEVLYGGLTLEAN